MGNVAKQSFLSSVSAYAGVALGYLNLVILMPKFMSEEEIGLFRVIISMAMILVPIVLFGSGGAILKFYPKLKNQKAGLHGFTSTIALLSFILITIFAVLFQDYIFGFYSEKAPQVNDYFHLVFVMLFLMAFYNFYTFICRANYSIVLPSILTEFGYKFQNTMLLLLLGIGAITFRYYLYGHILAYLILISIIVFFASRSFSIKFSFKRLLAHGFESEVFNFMSYSVLGGFGIMIVLQIDQIMVSQMLGLADNGIYSTAMMMALVIEYPKKFVAQIMQPYISQDTHDNDYEKIDLVYKKTSNLMIWLGGILFILIVVNLDNIFRIMPNGEIYRKGIWVVFIIGVTKLIDMVFSLNAEIIGLSKYYKVNVLLILLLAVMTVISNIILIPKYGMNGAAIATLLTYLVFNIIRYLILKIAFNISPFSIKTIKIILFLGVLYFLVSHIPFMVNSWIDLILRSGLAMIGFLISIRILKPSPEVMEITIEAINKIKFRIGRK